MAYIIKSVWNFISAINPIYKHIVDDNTATLERTKLIANLFGTIAITDISKVASIHYANVDGVLPNVEFVKYCHVQMNKDFVDDSKIDNSLDPVIEKKIYYTISMMKSLTYLEIVNFISHQYRRHPWMYALMQPLDLSANAELKRFKCYCISNLTLVYLPGDIIIDFTDCASKFTVELDITVIMSNVLIDITPNDIGYLQLNEYNVLGYDNHCYDIFRLDANQIDENGRLYGELQYGNRGNITMCTNSVITINRPSVNGCHIYIVLHTSNN